MGRLPGELILRTLSIFTRSFFFFVVSPRSPQLHLCVNPVLNFATRRFYGSASSIVISRHAIWFQRLISLLKIEREEKYQLFPWRKLLQYVLGCDRISREENTFTSFFFTRAFYKGVTLSRYPIFSKGFQSLDRNIVLAHLIWDYRSCFNARSCMNSNSDCNLFANIISCVNIICTKM